MPGVEMPVNVSVIMYGGLSYGGAHRQMIRLLCSMNTSKFNFTYFWCRPNQDIGSDFVWPELDYSNIILMESHGIRVIEFSARTRDISKRFHPWIDTDFFEKYSEVKTDLIFCCRAGYPEYPFVKLREPVVEWNIFGCTDSSANLVHSVLISEWSYQQWRKNAPNRSGEIIYPSVPAPADVRPLRQSLAIESDTVVLGFHQRVDEHIYGEQALRAYALALPHLKRKSRFIIVGGSQRYRSLAAELGIPVLFLPVMKAYEDVSAFLLSLDIFSHSGGAGEAHGTVIQEAMMHGLAVVTMRVPGCADGQVGTMADTGIVTDTVNDYAAAIVTLVNDSTARADHGGRARKHALHNYSSAVVASKFERLLIEKAAAYQGRKFRPFDSVNLRSLVRFLPFSSQLRAVARKTRQFRAAVQK